MPTSKATASWDGGLKDGKGTMKPGHGAEIAFSAKTRFEGQDGGNPEEMIGAALAGCFSMALAADLGRAGHAAQSIRTRAAVKLEMIDQKPTVTAIDLVTEAKVPGLDEAKLREVADGTRKNCPVARALASVEISVDAKLVS